MSGQVVSSIKTPVAYDIWDSPLLDGELELFMRRVIKA